MPLPTLLSVHFLEVTVCAAVYTQLCAASYRLCVFTISPRQWRQPSGQGAYLPPCWQGLWSRTHLVLHPLETLKPV